MLKLICGDESEIQKLIGSMGPHVQVLAAYAVNLKHFAWVRLPDPKKPEKKDK